MQFMNMTLERTKTSAQSSILLWNACLLIWKRFKKNFDYFIYSAPLMTSLTINKIAT